MLLSWAGKEILIKAVAQFIPTYTISVFQIPVKLCDELDALCAKFWWRQVGNERKIHWRSWDKLSTSKKDGGMGFWDLRAFNLAMPSKGGEWSKKLIHCSIGVLKRDTSHRLLFLRQLNHQIVPMYGKACWQPYQSSSLVIVREWGILIQFGFKVTSGFLIFHHIEYSIRPMMMLKVGLW